MYTYLAFYNQIVRWNNADIGFAISDNCSVAYCHFYTFLERFIGIPGIYFLSGLLLCYIITFASTNPLLNKNTGTNIASLFFLLMPQFYWGTLFIGKDGFIISIVVITLALGRLVGLARANLYLLWFTTIIIASALARPYFIVIIITATILAYTTQSIERRMKLIMNGKLSMKMLYADMLTVSLIAVSIAVIIYLGMHELFLKMGSDQDFAVDYANRGGSVILTPYGFPLSLLQAFRPFLWDFAGLSYKIYSLSTLMLLVVILRWKDNAGERANNNMVVNNIIGYAYVYLPVAGVLIYSVNPNIGDIARKMSTLFLLMLTGFCAKHASHMTRKVNIRA